MPIVRHIIFTHPPFPRAFAGWNSAVESFRRRFILVVVVVATAVWISMVYTWGRFAGEGADAAMPRPLEPYQRSARMNAVLFPLFCLSVLFFLHLLPPISHFRRCLRQPKRALLIPLLGRIIRTSLAAIHLALSTISFNSSSFVYPTGQRWSRQCIYCYQQPSRSPRVWPQHLARSIIIHAHPLPLLCWSYDCWKSCFVFSNTHSTNHRQQWLFDIVKDELRSEKTFLVNTHAPSMCPLRCDERTMNKDSHIIFK